MVITLILNILATFLGFLARSRNQRYMLRVVFFIYTVFLGMRYMWGNDMITYYNDFLSYRFITYDDLELFKEPGWIILNKICEPIGFFGMQFILSIFQNVVVYKLIKRYVPPKWYWFSIFLYGFDTHLMVLSASMMRQSLAMVIVLLSSKYIANKKILPFILTICIAGMFHISSLIILPFYFVTYLKFNIQEKFLPIIFIIMYILSFGLDMIAENVLSGFLNMNYFEKYNVYMNDGGEAGGRGLRYMLICFIASLSLIQSKYVKNAQRVFLFMNIVIILISPFMNITMLVSRITYYFYFFTILSYPIIVDSLKPNVINNLIKYSLVSIVMLLYIILLLNFFNDVVWHDSYYIYHSILSAPYWM